MLFEQTVRGVRELFRRELQFLHQGLGVVGHNRQADVIASVEMIDPTGREQRRGVGLPFRHFRPQGVARHSTQTHGLPLGRADNHRRGFHGTLRRGGQVLSPFHKHRVNRAVGAAVGHRGQCFASRKRRKERLRILCDLQCVGMRQHTRQGLAHARSPGNLTMLQFHHRLDQRHHAGQTKSVTDLADRRRENRRGIPLIIGEHVGQYGGFLFVDAAHSHRRHFHHPDRIRSDRHRFQRPLRRLTIGLGIVIDIQRDTNTTNHAANVVAVALRVRQPLEQYDGGTFCRNDAVHRLRERRVRFTRGQRAPQLKTFVNIHVHAALSCGAQDHIDRLVEQHADRGGDRRHRRCVAGINRERAPHHVERLGQPRRQGAGGKAARFIEQRRHVIEQQLFEIVHDLINISGRDPALLEFVPQIVLEFRHAQTHLHVAGKVPAEHRADNHRGTLTVERLLVISGVAHGLVGGVEQHELQRIRVGDLFRRNLVLLPVVNKVRHEPAADIPGAPRSLGSGIEINRWIPARRRDGGLGITTRDEQIPERVDRERAGQHGSHTHNRDCGIIRSLLRANHRTIGTGKDRHLCLQRLRGTIIHHHMHVEAADAKGIHGCPPCFTGLGFRPRC